MLFRPVASRLLCGAGLLIISLHCLAPETQAAPRSRITARVDTNRVTRMSSGVNRKAKPELDRALLVLDRSRQIHLIEGISSPALADDYRMHEFNGEMLRVGGVGATAEGEQAASAEEAL